MIKLREHQNECVNNIRSHFNEDEKRALIKMFCGSGKSFVIYHSLLEFGGNLSVVVVPSINLITQFNKDYLLDDTKISYNKKHFNKSFKVLTVCSKNELSDHNINITTDENTIDKFLSKKANKIVLITYQSLPIFCKVIVDGGYSIDLLCFDEAHHILGDGMKKLLFGYDEEDYDDEESEDNNVIGFIDNSVDKTLFFTATPKNSNGIMMYEPVIEDDYEDDENSFYGDEIHCGKMIFEYMHLNGVIDNILNDFQIRVDLYTDDNDISVFDAISRSILETGNNKVLTFHARSEVSGENGYTNVVDFSSQKDAFVKSFNRIVKKEFADKKGYYKKINFEGFTAKTKNRMQVLNDFDSTKDDEIYIIASCKTIGEGVDTKRANMVVFVDPKQSYVDIIQNIGRVCRKNEQMSTVLIPCHVDVKKYRKGMTVEERDEVIRKEMKKKGDFNGIMNVLSALRQEDPYLFELCLNYPNVFTKKEMKNNMKKNGINVNDTEYNCTELFEKYDMEYNEKKTEKHNFKKLAGELDVNIQVMNNKILEDDIFIDNGSTKTMYVAKVDDDRYIVSDGTKKKDKIERPNRKSADPSIHANDEIKVLWSIDKMVNNNGIGGAFIKSTIVVKSYEEFKYQLDEIRKYIDENKKRPAECNKNKVVKKMGKLLSRWLSQYKKNIGIMRDKKKQKEFYEFLNDYKEYFQSNIENWKKKLEKIIYFIKQNNKLPSRCSKCKYERGMGNWIGRNKQSYRKKTKIMKDKNIRKIWENFVNEYKHYFQEYNEIWMQNLNKVCEYIDENKKRPSNEDKDKNIAQLGTWISTQQKNYALLKGIMKDKNIKKEWGNFRLKYYEYLCSIEEIWNNNLEKVTQYIEQNKKIPSQVDKDNNVSVLGRWLNQQNIHFNNKTDGMKNEERRKIYETFKNTYKDYFISNEELWIGMLDVLKKFINEHNRRPTDKSSNCDEKKIGKWLSHQILQYRTNDRIMKNENIKIMWQKFIEEYDEYFVSNDKIWNDNLTKVKEYINKNNKKPSVADNDKEIKFLGNWISMQQKNYAKTEKIMKDENIRKEWEEFVTKYAIHFPNNIAIKDKIIKKSTKIKQTIETETINKNRKYTETEYLNLCKKMQIQKSTTTANMFNDDKELWERYHEYRDKSFKGYDNQNELPINKIIEYLETIKTRKLKILDLGCGRNKIKDHFKKNKKMEIIGYDHVSFNDSIECDISNLPDEDETVNICIFSQSLMGTNWSTYIDEAKRVLSHNGEMIIVESNKDYEKIKAYIESNELRILDDNYDETNRWFMLRAIK